MKNYRALKAAGNIEVATEDQVGLAAVRQKKFNSDTGADEGFTGREDRYDLQEIDRQISLNQEEALELAALKADIISAEGNR